MTLVIWETSRSLWLLPSPHTQMGRSLDLHQRGGPLPEHTADTRLRRSFLAKSPYVTISSRLFVQSSFATTVHSLQNLNIKARGLPSFFGPHWRRTWRFVKFVLPEVFQASLWAFSLTIFFSGAHLSSAVTTRGIYPPQHTSVELTEALMHNLQGHNHLAYFSSKTYWSTPVLCQH